MRCAHRLTNQNRPFKTILRAHPARMGLVASFCGLFGREGKWFNFVGRKIFSEKSLHLRRARRLRLFARKRPALEFSSSVLEEISLYISDVLNCPETTFSEYWRDCANLRSWRIEVITSLSVDFASLPSAASL
jgi:hypothetical protein